MKGYIIKQSTISLCVYLGQFLSGAGFGWSSPVIPKLQDPEQNPLPDVITDGQASWANSTIYVGYMLGPFMAGYISNRFGRKPTLLFAGALSAIGCVLLATAVNIAMIFIGRILMGFAGGMITVTNFVYLGEIASVNIRGVLLTIVGIFQTLGTLVVFSTAPFVSYAWAAYIILAFNMAYLLGLLWIPESPMFFALRGRETEAERSLKALGRTDILDITTTLADKNKAPPTIVSGWKDLFAMKSNRRALFITLPLVIAQQLSGVMPVVAYATTIFAIAGSTIEPDLATIVVGITQALASCIAPIFVEKTGRRFLLLTSCAGCFLSLATLGVYFFLDDFGFDMTVVGWLPLLTIVLFFLAYDCGFSIIPNAFIGELFGPSVRSTGSVAAISVMWTFGFAVSTAFGYLLPVVGGYYIFWFFSLGCAAAFLFTYFFVPETKGMTLIEIQEMLGNKT